MNFLNKTWLWVAITLIFSLCLTTVAGASLLDIFVMEHESNEDIIVESIYFGTPSSTSGINNSNNITNSGNLNGTGGATNKVPSSTTNTNNNSGNSSNSSNSGSSTNSGTNKPGSSTSSSSSSTSNSTVSGSLSTPTTAAETILSATEFATLSKSISVTKQVGTYSNANVSLALTEKVFTSGSDETTYFVAHIKVSSAQYFKTALASGNKLVVNTKAKVATLAKNNNAIFAINGDGCGQSHTTGYVVRNGIQYRSSARDSSGETESLILYGDGSMQIIDELNTPLSSISNAWQVFSFGPGLIKNNAIAVTKNQEISGDKSMNDNPRTAIGMVEPLHYVIIVGNGRTDESKGLSLYQLAQALAYEGCTLGYNLDGGGSSTLWFNGNVINYPTTNGRYSEREVSDIVYIGA